MGFQQPVVRPFFEPRGLHLGTKSFPDMLLAVAQVLEMDLGLPGETFQEIIQNGAKELFESGRGVVGETRTSEVGDFKSFWNTAPSTWLLAGRIGHI